MSGTQISKFGDPAKFWTVPPEDVKRQATDALRGYVYQLHASAAAWIKLGPEDQLHLEVAEDFAKTLLGPDAANDVLQATQVKDTYSSGSVTLNSLSVIEAIESLHRLRVSNPGRKISFVFLTTSNIGKERKNALPSGVAGLTAWEQAAGGEDVEELRTALLQRTLSKELKGFVTNSAPEELREEIFRALNFICGAQDWHTLEEENRRSLVALRNEIDATADMAYRAYDAIFRDVVACVIGLPPRSLDRDRLLSCLERATSIRVPSGHLISQFRSHEEHPRSPVSIEILRDMASELIKSGAPPSVELLFPDAHTEVRCALNDMFAAEPRLTEVVNDKAPINARVVDLIKLPEKRHLIIGQPGSGKTHALWQAAKALLAAGEIVPLYLQAGFAAGWSDLEELIRDAAPGIDLSNLFNDPRICVFVDGWSEFAAGAHTGEKQRILRSLRNTRIVATARFADIDDGVLKNWTLDLLPLEGVSRTLVAATPDEALPPSNIQDLLRLPLLFAIYVLAGARSTETGDLLRQFHERLAHNLPERFTDVLAGAVADLSLDGTRAFGRLTHVLQTRAASAGLMDPIKLLRNLGTIIERGGQAVPIHDLYWSWLAGRGLLFEARAEDALGPLRTRESYTLAIQAGGQALDSDVNAAVKSDLVLAALLDASRGKEQPVSVLREALTLAFADPRLAVRNRAALAALEGEWSEFFRPALDVLSELGQARISWPVWKNALRPDYLYARRATLAEWFGSPNTNLVLDVIAERGGPEWTSWLEQIATWERIRWDDASAAALACCQHIPTWVQPYLDAIVADRPWKLRSVARRRGNGALARFLAIHYERLVEKVIDPKSSAWFDLNRVLVGCGDDNVFSILLTRFPSMSARAQELLGFAIVELGAPWVARFQRISLSTGEEHHHKLAEQVSLEIDDATAREWIDAEHEAAGWRVLIARHGEALLPEMIAQLPSSFADMHHIPALAHMRWLPSAPSTLIDELWSRLGSPMQPKATQDLLNATARVYPAGVPHIVKFITSQPDALPAYHLGQAFQLYNDWRKKSGLELGVKAPNGFELPFPEAISLWRATKDWEDHFTPELLAFSPRLAIDFVLHRLKDNKRAAAVLMALRGNVPYTEKLLEHMLATPALAKLIPEVFVDSFDQFPVSSLLKCLSSDDIDQDMLLFRLASTANPMHRAAHELLIARVLEEPSDMKHLSYVASMLKAYAREEVMRLLGSAPGNHEDRWFWFVRFVETARDERLIDEAGAALP